MPEMTFTLHGSPHSQFTYKVALMLRLCGIPFAFRYVSFRDNAHRTQEFLALNRFGQVPVLEHGDEVYCQSAAILLHLADATGRFSGSDATARRVIRETLFWNADRLGPPVYRSHGFELGRLGVLARPADPAIVAHYRDLADAAFGVLDRMLADRDFLAGADPTVADIACYGEAAFAPHAGLDISACSNLGRWGRRLAALPGFKAPFELLPMANAEIV